MRKVVLFIAMSLDGYIADEHGNVDWLNGQDMSVENIDTYSVFVQDVDTVIMGWDTYHQIVTELSPVEWMVIPTILGSGIRLFGTTPDEIKLKLISTQTYNGIVELIYTRR